MKREFHVRFCEGAGVQFPCATRRSRLHRISSGKYCPPPLKTGRLIFTRSGGHLSKLGMIRAEVMDGEYSTGIHG